MAFLKKVNISVNKLFFLSIILFSILVFDHVEGQDVDIPRIKYIETNTDNVIIEWEPSETPGVQWYTVHYKYQGLNPRPDWKQIARIDASQPLKAEFSKNQIDTSLVNIYKEPVAFAVQAHVNSTTESLFEDYFWDSIWWDSTIFVKGEYDTCLSQIELSWSTYSYNMWGKNDIGEGIFGYRIEVFENGIEVFPKVFTTLTNYTLTTLSPNNEYEIYILARPYDSNAGFSTSNTLHVNTHMSIVPRHIYADFATNSGDNVEVRFTVDSRSELKEYYLLRSNNIDGPYDTIDFVEPTDSTIIYINNVDYMAGPYYYSLLAKNNCGVIVCESENIASSIVLNHTGEPIRPELTWNEYENWLDGVAYYTVERKIGEGEFESISEVNTNSFTDAEIEQLQGTGIDANVCYRIIAEESNNMYNINARSESNEICIELPVNIRFEFDAFTPGNSWGNSSFGPTIDYLPDEFEFKILNRSGMVVYETSNPNNSRWDGRYKGNIVPQGAYMYVVQFRNRGGKRKVLRGGVVVLHTNE